MRVSSIRCSLGLLAIIFSLSSFGAVRLDMDTMRSEVLSDNIELKIQYENYYQSQRNVSVAFGQFLPSLNVNYIYVNTTLALLQSLVPTPSGWFRYQGSKELAVAERFTSESIRLNILEGLTVNYINIKYLEELLVSLDEQETILEEAYNEALKREEMGLADASEVFAAKRSLYQHRQDIFQIESTLIAQKQALLIGLDRSPGDDLILDELPEDELAGIPESVDEGISLALSNSTELVSNSYQRDAAFYMTKAARWSFVSFNGIGFDYFATVSIEKSKGRIIELQAQQLANKIENQVFAAYASIDILDKRIALQESIIDSLGPIDERNTELYLGNALSAKDYIIFKAEVMSERNALIRLRMERRVKIAQLRRLLGLDASLNETEIKSNDIEFYAETENALRGKKHVWIKLTGVSASDVFAVNYTVEGVVFDRRVYSANQAPTYYFKASRSGEYNLKAKIYLLSGQIIEKEQTVVVY